MRCRVGADQSSIIRIVMKLEYNFEDNQKKVAALYPTPLMDLIYEAHTLHRKFHKAGEVQASSLLSVKTGGCPENCSYCPQSAHYQTGVKKEALMSTEQILEKAQAAKSKGATRFCMGAAWRQVRDGAEFDNLLESVKAVHNLDLEVCCTLGMLNQDQANRLKEAGVYAYNHNIDTSRKHYSKVISTRDYDERLKTISFARKSGMTVCTGGILGMGESDQDRIDFLAQLCSFEKDPESITINTLVPFDGTPLEKSEQISVSIILRVIAMARILIPKAKVRLSAGRLNLSPAEQFMCFFAGGNSIFLGDKLLTSPNPEVEDDMKLLQEFDLSFEKPKLKQKIQKEGIPLGL